MDFMVDTKSTVNALSARGPFMARLDSIVGGRFANKGHFVVVDGLDKAGNVLIRDPAGGTKYAMDIADFAKHQTGQVVWKVK